MPLHLLEQLRSAITPQIVGYAAKALGETPAATQRAIDLVLPAILSGLASATRMPGGLATVARLILDPVNDGTLLQQLPALYQGTMTAAPAYRLGSQLLHSIFGSKLGHVTQTAAVLASVKPAASALLVSTLAPHVVSVLGERLRIGADATPAALAGLFETERLPIQAALAPEFEHIFGPPWLAPTAANAATANSASAVAVTHPAVLAATTAARSVPSPATAAATTAPTATAAAATAATRAPRVEAAARSGSGLWIIFPAGVAFGMLGLLASFGSRFDSQDRRPAAPVTAEASAPAPIVAAKPASPSSPAVAAVKPLPAAPVPAAKAPDAKPAAAAKAPEAKPIAAAKPATKPATEVAAAPPPPGVTTYFGVTPPLGEGTARPNPDYAPIVAAEVVTPVEPAPPVPAVEPVAGITSYFGPGKPVAETAAIANPDYTPPTAAPLATAATPAPAEVAPDAPVAEPAPHVPGATTYFGPGKSVKDAAAIANPDYKPAPASLPVVAPVVAATVPAAAPIASCQDTVATAVKSGLVLFNSARATLKSGSIGTLNRIAAAFLACRDKALRIEGHTDSTGNSDMNQKLSEARAQTVAQYLVSKGIETGRVTSAGFGQARPVAPNDTAANKALNRRIEFIVQDK